MLVIGKKTRTQDVLPLITTEERLQAVLDAVPAVPLEVQTLDLPLGDFLQAVTDKTYSLRFFKERYALTAFGKLKTHISDIKTITAFVDRLKVERSGDELQASAGVPFPDFALRVLLDVARFFSLHSLSDAERVPVHDWLAVYQDSAANAIYKRRLAAIQEARDESMKGGRR